MTACRTCQRPALTPAQKLTLSKVAAQRALLDKIKSETRIWPPQYLRYSEIPAPTPEERERFKVRFLDLIERLAAGVDVPDHPDVAREREWAAHKAKEMP